MRSKVIPRYFGFGVDLFPSVHGNAWPGMHGPGLPSDGFVHIASN